MIRRLAPAVSLVVAFVFSLFFGRYPAPGFTDPVSLVSDDMAGLIVRDARAPRSLAAMVLGASLAAAGWTYQVVFANPVVEPGFLGVSQGAALGAAIAIVSGLRDPSLVALCAFAGAIAGLALSALLGRMFRFGGGVIRLALAGIAVSALLSSMLALVKYVADPIAQLPDIVFWTMGSLAGMGWDRLFPAVPVSLLALAVLYALRWRVMVASLDDHAARSLTGDPRRIRALALVAASACVAAMTSACGTVGWIGLAAPHLARSLAGADGRRSLPASMVIGAALVLACDTVARTLLPGELPLGIPAAIAGCACFIALFATGSARIAR